MEKPQKYSLEERVSKLFTFLTEPNSDKWSFYYGIFVVSLVLCHVILLVLASCDGPNHYEGRKDMSLYSTLPNEQMYRVLQMVCWVPLTVDAAVRMLVLLLMYCHDDLEMLMEELLQDNFKCVLLLCDVVSPLAFLVEVLYVIPRGVQPSQGFRLLLRFIDLLATARIIRGTKDIPALKAIRIALQKSIPHLVVPLFFFFVFNITFGVAVYFLEPCYDYTVCPWEDLFEASFFSVVTMTTTGYGNQTPLYLPSRLVACLIMMFGSLFMSMPLAIIGNEYEDACQELTVIQADVDTIIQEKDAEMKLLQEQQQEVAATGGSGNSSVRSSATNSLRASAEKVAGLVTAFKKTISPTSRNASASSSGDGAALGSFFGGEATASTSSRAEMRSNANGAASGMFVVTEVDEIEDPEEEKSGTVQEEKQGSYDAKRGIVSVAAMSGQNVRNSGTDIDHEPQTTSPTTNGDMWNNNSTANSPMIDCLTQLNTSLSVLEKELHSGVRKMTPSMLLLMCEMRGWLTPLKWSISSAVSDIVRRESVTQLPAGDSMTSRKMSIFGGRRKSADGANQNSRAGSAVSNDASSSRQSLLQSILSRHFSSNSFNKMSSEEPAAHTSLLNRVTRFIGGGSRGAMTSVLPSSVEMPQRSKSRNQLAEESSISSNSSGEHRPAESLRDTRVLHHLSSRSLVAEMTNRLLKSKSQGGRTASGRGAGAGANTFVVKLAKAADDIVGIQDKDFALKIERAVRNPHALRTRIWMLLELPHSSRGAKAMQVFQIILIVLSVLMLYTQTLTSFTNYGEDSSLCGIVLQKYCDNKYDNEWDPGCFVHNGNTSTSMKLRYHCDSDDCFSHGYNFGSQLTNLTCRNINDPPFQTSEELILHYQRPDFTLSRDTFHQIQNVCNRLECRYTDENIVNGHVVWMPVESLINCFFTLEIALRIFVSETLSGFFFDFLNIFDILSVIPFYTDAVAALSSPGEFSMSFSILASSPQSVLLVSMKSFKITRHFRASEVLFETARRAYKQIIGILSLLFFIVAVFAILLFEVEQGYSCYAGDAGCDIPEELEGTVKVGERITTNKNGEVTAFTNVLDGLWFSIVTLTSTGYGDIVPATNLGQVMSIVLMLFGAIYLAMPLTAAATTFYAVHEAYNAQRNRKNAKVAAASVAPQISLPTLDNRQKARYAYIQRCLEDAADSIVEFFAEIQAPISAANESKERSRVSVMERCSQVATILRSTIDNYSDDIRRLSEMHNSVTKTPQK